MPPPLPRPPKPPALLPRRAVIERTGLSESQIDSLEAAGRFPVRVPLSMRRVGWLESEIDAWVASCIAARDDRTQQQKALNARMPASVTQRRATSATAE